MKKPKWRLGAIVSAAVTVIGALASPAVLDLLPGKIAVVVTVAGAIIQAFTEPAARAEHER